MSQQWIHCLPGRDQHPLPLYCLPHAGGNAALYRNWRACLPESISLNLITLPGRLERWQQAMPDSMPALVTQLADQLAPDINVPWAIFGHSMGAVVAHELILELQRRGKPAPLLLAVSAREAPQFHQPGTLHQQSDRQLCDELLRLGGTQPALLEIAEMRDFILPVMRADYALIEGWELSDRQPLSCPIAAFVGRDDPELDENAARGWAQWTDAGFTLDSFAGGHFYFNHQPQPVINRLVAHVQRIQRASVAPVA